MGRHIARAVCGVLLAWAAAAAAAPSVTIVATDPLQAMVVGRNDSVYAHVHYHSEQPVRMRIAGMLDGENIKLIHGVSPPYRAGDGDVVVWLGSARPPQTIDTVRVTLVDNHENELDVATMPLRISWDAGVASNHPRAAWVAPLQARQQQLIDKAITAARNRHAAGGWWIGPLLVVATPGYLLLQVLLARWWRGRWRVAALLPLVVMVPAYAFSIMALLAGSNLWPLVVLFLSPVAFAWLLVLLTLHGWQRRSSPV